MKVNHIGIAVKDIDKIIYEYEVLGYTKEGNKIKDEKRNIWIQFMVNGLDHRIELIMSIDANKPSPIDSIIASTKQSSMYHICYEVENIEEEIEELKEKKYLLIKEISTAIAFDNRRVCFMFHKYIGIIELLESGCCNILD